MRSKSNIPGARLVRNVKRVWGESGLVTGTNYDQSSQKLCEAAYRCVCKLRKVDGV